MACCGGSSSVVITGGDNTIVTGSGTVADPYVISGNLEVILQAKNTPTVSMELTGTGNANDPFILSANATVRVNDLIDVDDPVPPVENDTLLFKDGVWGYGPAASVPAGSIVVGGGIEGDGTVGTPLKVKVSNALDTSVTGLYTYVDANGELRVQVPAVGTVDWGNIVNKPSSFPPPRPLTADSILNSYGTNTAVPGIRIWVGPTTPVGAVNNDIWFQTA